MIDCRYDGKGLETVLSLNGDERPGYSVFQSVSIGRGGGIPLILRYGNGRSVDGMPVRVDIA